MIELSELKQDIPVTELTHFNQDGAAHMVDVGQKQITHRVAIAEGKIHLSPATLERVVQGTMAKGDVLSVARLAGIMGVKRTADLIPLCHPLALSHVNIDFDIESDGVRCTVRTECHGQTGVEMEAINGVQITLLTIFDMCKAIDRKMRIGGVRLLEKKGGKSGHFHADRG